MNYNHIYIDFNKRKGYCIYSVVLEEHGPWRPSKPVFILKPDATWEEIYYAVENVANETQGKILPKGSKGYSFWNDAGCKTWSQFIRQFKVLTLAKEDKYEINLHVVEKGGSICSSKTPIEMPIDTDIEEVICKVMKVLKNENGIRDDKENNVELEFINGKRCKYKIPCDRLVDVDDFETDAYKVYLFDNETNSYLAFLIDNGYKEFNEEKIVERWHAMYGDISIDFQNVDSNMIKFSISAQSEKCIIKSNFIKAGDELVEYMVYVDLANNKRDAKIIIDEYEQVLNSITLM